MTNILVLPDSHAHPDHHNKRYEWLGHMILDTKPDVVVDIGDFWDFASLSSYETGAKKAFEGRQYNKDLNSGLDAQDRMFTVIRRAKRRLPRFVRTLGNHEDRITRALNADPVLHGTIGLEDLDSKQYGWEEYPFLQEVQIDGVHFAHYFVSGIAGRAISGEHPGFSLIQKRLSTSVQGHSHLFDHCVRVDANGRRVHGLAVGCYQDYDADWAGPVNRLWSRGVCILKNVENGDFDHEWISLKYIKQAYGGLDGV